VQRRRTHKRTGEEKIGTRYFVTSHRAQPALAERVSKQIRGYWGVENIVHWRRDVIGGEDKCRLRDPNSACALALVRTALLTLVLCSGRSSLQQAHEEFENDPASALHLIRFQRLSYRG